jgi:hypothetical protein
MTDLAAEHGFTDITVASLRGQLTVPGDDDITSQHMLTARRALGRPQAGDDAPPGEPFNNLSNQKNFLHDR